MKIQITIEITGNEEPKIEIIQPPIDIQKSIETPKEETPNIKKMGKGYKIPKTKMCIHCGNMFSPQGLAKHKKYCQKERYKDTVDTRIPQNDKHTEIPIIEVFNGKTTYEKKDGNALRMH